MVRLGERIQEGDWRAEKHVPVIDCPDQVKPDQLFEVKVGLGRDIPHPNTTDHHIRYITLFFHPEGDKFTHRVGHYEFSAHGESVDGPNKGPVYTHHETTASLKISKPGTLYALAYCNIHGLWESAKEVKTA